MTLNETLSEKIISRLDAGESSESILNTMKSEDKIEVQEFLDLWDFMKAQNLEIKPSKSGFKNTLKQAILLSESDDEVVGWGSFFSPQIFRNFYFKTFGGLAFSLLLVLGVSQEFMGNYFNVKDEKSFTQQNLSPNNNANLLKNKKLLSINTASLQENDFSSVLAKINTQPNLILDSDLQIVKDLEAEFDADIDDFYKTQKSLKSFYQETLFEDNDSEKISKLYKTKNNTILAKRDNSYYL